ncbi:hypothetical protein GCM10009754_44660 [Amycolatopsis minnesotensis]|uniref:Secreted protein n=1 Tax=Amycolatopsis minnesotensis TaxID=337894 RepID=A0ABN2RCU4_9PSEU
MVLASAVASADPIGLRYTATPISTPSTAAMMVHCTTALVCSHAWSEMLLQRSEMYSKTFMTGGSGRRDVPRGFP